jgi:tetratricopeptide (TPR) repeat protein
MLKRWLADARLRAQTRDRSTLLATSLLVGLLCSCLASSGCKALSCKLANDENITAARQLSLQGMGAQQKGRWDQAETLYASAVTKCPTDERARCGYAESLWQRGAHDEAVSHMEEAVRLSGDDPERMVQLGNMYLSLGQLDRSKAFADKAINANRHLAGAWALRGDIERAQGRASEALASYHRTLSLQPHYPDVQFALAEMYAQQSRPQRALATLQSLADDFPPGQIPSNVLYREGLVLRQLGRYQDAAKALAMASEKGEPSAEALNELARTQLLAGDPASAGLANAAALARDPNHVPSQQLRAELDGRQQMAVTSRSLQRL